VWCSRNRVSVASQASTSRLVCSGRICQVAMRVHSTRSPSHLPMPNQCANPPTRHHKPQTQLLCITYTLARHTHISTSDSAVIFDLTNSPACHAIHGQYYYYYFIHTCTLVVRIATNDAKSRHAIALIKQASNQSTNLNQSIYTYTTAAPDRRASNSLRCFKR
jgi:hypothetical protein